MSTVAPSGRPSGAGPARAPCVALRESEGAAWGAGRGASQGTWRSRSGAHCRRRARSQTDPPTTRAPTAAASGDPSAGAERGQDRLSLTQLRAPEQKGFSRRCLRGCAEQWPPGDSGPNVGESRRFLKKQQKKIDFMSIATDLQKSSLFHFFRSLSKCDFLTF